MELAARPGSRVPGPQQKRPVDPREFLKLPRGKPQPLVSVVTQPRVAEALIGLRLDQPLGDGREQATQRPQGPRIAGRPSGALSATGSLCVTPHAESSSRGRTASPRSGLSTGSSRALSRVSSCVLECSSGAAPEPAEVGGTDIVLALDIGENKTKIKRSIGAQARGSHQLLLAPNHALIGHDLPDAIAAADESGSWQPSTSPT